MKNKLSIKQIISIILLTVIIAPNSAYAQSMRQEMDKIVIDTIKEKNIPGAIVGIWYGSGSAWVKAFGKSDIGSGKDMHYSVKFRIGGITQTFLATLLLSYVDDKKINLDEPVAKYLPFVPNGEKISVRQLVNNTSGIFDYTEDAGFWPRVFKDPLREWQPMELVNIAFKHEPYFKPGEGWHYSNTNFILLGMIIEKVTSEKLEDSLKFRVIKRLGVENTFFTTEPFMTGHYARGYMSKEGSVVPEDITLLDPSVEWAAGAIVSDLQNMSLWAKAFYRGSFLSDKLREARFDWIDTGEPYCKYGLGVFKVGDFIGYKGGMPGYSCTMFYLPEQNVTIIVMLNKFPDDGAAFSIFKALAKIVVPDYAPWQ